MSWFHACPGQRWCLSFILQEWVRWLQAWCQGLPKGGLLPRAATAGWGQVNNLLDLWQSSLLRFCPSGCGLGSSSGQPGLPDGKLSLCKMLVFRWRGGGLPSGGSSLSLQQNSSNELWFLMQWHAKLSGFWHVSVHISQRDNVQADSGWFYANKALLLLLLV